MLLVRTGFAASTGLPLRRISVWNFSSTAAWLTDERLPGARSSYFLSFGRSASILPSGSPEQDAEASRSLSSYRKGQSQRQRNAVDVPAPRGPATEMQTNAIARCQQRSGNSSAASQHDRP